MIVPEKLRKDIGIMEELLTKWKIEYKKIDEEKNLRLFKIKSKIHLLYMENKGNQFLISRDFFEYLDSNSLPYTILLHDISKDKYYYLELRKANNWIKSCFATCDKDEIFLGKQVLNYPIDEISLQMKLKNI